MISHWENRFLKQQKLKFIAGVDEAGRGPLAGPLVVAAVIIKPEKNNFFSFLDFKNSIADSKTLTVQERENAFDEIMAKSWIGVGIADVALIDNSNISLATSFAAETAINNLAKKPDYILADGGIILSSDYSYTCLIKGETKSFLIACASIIAKVVRDRIMDVYDRFFPYYAFRKHKGYGTELHFNLLREYGPSPIHRKSFSPIKDWF